uniref:Protease n=1 Tax=viral metagenome TaxID=1070528 RepID=A0A6C0I9P5_9ZZZZ
MKKGYILNKKNDSDDDSESGLPFDPGSLFGNFLKKDNDIRVEGNKVYFYKEITRDSVASLIHTLNQTIKKVKSTAEFIGSVEDPPVYLFINSGGGDYYAGMSGFDHIKNMDYPVYTVIDGVTASAGTFISLAGKKRFIMKSSWVLIHQIKTWFEGYNTFEELKDEMLNSSNIMKSLNNMYLENTKISSKKLNTFFQRDIYLDSTDAIKLGIADSLYVNNKRKY